MYIKEVNDENFSEETKNAEKLLICFLANWCSICSTLFPTLEEIAKEINGKVELVKVDIDENPQLIERFNIMSVPSLVLFQQGKVIKKLVTSESKEKIISQLF
ncbi:thiol reductase thioredoxin [Priestia megaterium]|nr:thiol reductase thioredoxin [Priestia megaterium]